MSSNEPARSRAPAQQLLEVITPRTNAALITPAENLCGSLSLDITSPGGGAVALEIVADEERSRFFVRSESKSEQRQLQGQIGAAYPQATLLLLGLADVLEVPLRERNAFLLAAGYAPYYQQRPLEDPTMTRVRAAVERLLGSHDPYPGVAVDLLWNVVLANDASQRLVALLPAGLAGPPLNIFRACLHPEGLARRTLNFSEWAAYLLGQLHRLQVLTADPDVAELADEVARYPTVAGLGDWREVATPDEPALLVPWRLRLDSVDLSLFTTLTTFGTPHDITLAELAVELFYPADDASEAVLRRW